MAFTRHSTWEFRHQGMARMEVSYGQPCLPRPFKSSDFKDPLARGHPGHATGGHRRAMEAAHKRRQHRGTVRCW